MAKVSENAHRAVWDREAKGRRTAKCQVPKCVLRWAYKKKFHDYHIAHNTAKQKGGSNDPANLLLLCHQHNQLMKTMSWVEFLKKNGMSVKAATAGEPYAAPTISGQPLKLVCKRFLQEMCVQLV